MYRPFNAATKAGSFLTRAERKGLTDAQRKLAGDVEEFFFGCCKCSKRSNGFKKLN